MSSTTITPSYAAEITPGKGLHDELIAYCSGKEVTMEGLHEIIVNRWGWSPKKKIDNFAFFLRLLCNENFTVTEGMVKFILQYIPEAVFVRTSAQKKTVVHVMLQNKFVTPQVVQILVDAFPRCVWIQDTNGLTPIHALCAADCHDDSVKVDILDILLGSVGLHNNKMKLLKIGANSVQRRMLPIHFAALNKSTSATFMEKLIEVCPRYVLSSTAESGFTPLHCACYKNNLAVVEVLVKAYPKGLDIKSKGSHNFRGYPINIAIRKANEENYMDKTKPYVDVVRFLVNFPGSRASTQMYEYHSPLHWACLLASSRQARVEGIEEISLELVRILFDSCPAAIQLSDIGLFFQAHAPTAQQDPRAVLHPSVMEFLAYHRVFTLPFNELKEIYGPYPLHSIIMKNECLGSIKLLVKGNPAALQIPNDDGVIPLHLAVQHHHSIEVIQFLIKFDRSTLIMSDSEGNTALHHACSCARYNIVTLLLKRHGAVSVSKQNLKGKLPIELLLFRADSDSTLDNDSTTYTSTVYHLLRSYPDTLMKMDPMKVPSAQNGKSKRW